jgi:hypothetical protein
MAIDRPVATQRFETSPEGEDVVVVEVSVLSGDRRACVILLDLSDSSTLAAQDVRRLRKVLQVVPRDWAAIVRPFGRREGGAAGLDSTVGEVVDGAADIEGTLLGDESLRTGRMTGSFLGHALRQAAIDDVASRFEATLLLVLTDGRLHDVTAVELPRGVSAVGMGIGPAIDIHRWQDIVPHAELLAPSRSDTMAVVRRQAGCSFLGLCRIEVPGMSYRFGAALDAARIRAERTEGAVSWDFSRGAARIEIPGAFAKPGAEIRVTADDGSSASLGISVETAAVPKPDDTPTATSPVGHVVDMTAADAAALMKHVVDLVGQRTPWQQVDGRLSIMEAGSLPPAVASSRGLPCCHAMVVVVPDVGDPACEARVPVVWIPLHRDSDAAVQVADCLAGASFVTNEPARLMFHRLDARWLVSVGEREAASLPPRFGQELSVAVATRDGVRCRTFFSGTLRGVPEST